MALVTIPGGLQIPPIKFANSVPVGNNTLFDAATDKFALVCRAPKTGTIDRVVVTVGTAATPQALDVRIETVNTASATPTGTLWGTNTEGTTALPSANSQIEATLTAGASVTAGDVIAIVATPNTTPISLNLHGANGGFSAGAHFPYGVEQTGGAYFTSTSIPCYSVRYTTGEWAYLGPSVLPFLSNAAPTYTTGTGATTGTRRGLRFALPFPATLAGCWARASAGGNADFAIRLYDSAGSLIATCATVDASQQRSTTTAAIWAFLFDAPQAIAANTPYRLTLDALTANLNVSLNEMAVADAAYLDAFEGGQAFHLTKFVSSAWVDVPTERPWMGLILSAVDDGSGGGGGSSEHSFVSFG